MYDIASHVLILLIVRNGASFGAGILLKRLVGIVTFL